MSHLIKSIGHYHDFGFCHDVAGNIHSVTLEESSLRSWFIWISLVITAELNIHELMCCWTMAQCWINVLHVGHHFNKRLANQQMPNVEPMLVSRWPTVCDTGPTWKQPWFYICRVRILNVTLRSLFTTRLRIDFRRDLVKFVFLHQSSHLDLVPYRCEVTSWSLSCSLGLQFDNGKFTKTGFRCS